jgi:uncharacterized protein YbaR (Trm112 family)
MLTIHARVLALSREQDYKLSRIMFVCKYLGSICKYETSFILLAGVKKSLAEAVLSSNFPQTVAILMVQSRALRYHIEQCLTLHSCELWYSITDEIHTFSFSFFLKSKNKNKNYQKSQSLHPQPQNKTKQNKTKAQRATGPKKSPKERAATLSSHCFTQPSVYRVTPFFEPFFLHVFKFCPKATETAGPGFQH